MRLPPVDQAQAAGFAGNPEDLPLDETPAPAPVPVEAVPLETADLRVLLRVYHANVHAIEIGMPAGTPFLFDGRSWKRARALCVSGHLKLHDVGMAPPIESLVPVTITQAGIDAYNAAIAKAQGATS